MGEHHGERGQCAHAVEAKAAFAHRGWLALAPRWQGQAQHGFQCVATATAVALNASRRIGVCAGKVRAAKEDVPERCERSEVFVEMLGVR